VAASLRIIAGPERRLGPVGGGSRPVTLSDTV
jgi:hypothetical protein